MPNLHLALLALVVLSAAGSSATGADPVPARWSWQESQAGVDPRGDLAWKPRPYVFEKGASVRYIDFQSGDDANSGDAAGKPWKHHPWKPGGARRVLARARAWKSAVRARWRSPAT